MQSQVLLYLLKWCVVGGMVSGDGNTRHWQIPCLLQPCHSLKTQARRYLGLCQQLSESDFNLVLCLRMLEIHAHHCPERCTMSMPGCTVAITSLVPHASLIGHHKCPSQRRESPLCLL